MKVYVFGNKDFEGDIIAIHAADRLNNKVAGIEFVEVKPNEDLPFIGKDHVVLMDGVVGIKKVTIITEKDLGKLSLTKSITVHDFDLGFQIKYLKKIGKLKKITIIGLPINKKFNYFRIQSILRKLVEQEMQGS